MRGQQNAGPISMLFSRGSLALMALVGIGALFLMTEHAPHVAGLLAYALLLALPLILLFTRSGNGDAQAAAQPDEEIQTNGTVPSNE
jgi:hypothetical protein